METYILQLLVLLQIKHWFIDFVNQSDKEVASKGNYGEFDGLWHSIKHGVLTALCVFFITGLPYIFYAIIMGVIDFVAHYHIDWLKMNYGNRDIKSPTFWNHLGLDQMAHQMVYLLIAFLVS